MVMKSTYQNLWNASNVVGGRFVKLNTYIRKDERFKLMIVSDLKKFYLLRKRRTS